MPNSAAAAVDRVICAQALCLASYRRVFYRETCLYSASSGLSPSMNAGAPARPICLRRHTTTDIRRGSMARTLARPPSFCYRPPQVASTSPTHSTLAGSQNFLQPRVTPDRGHRRDNPRSAEAGAQDCAREMQPIRAATPDTPARQPVACPARVVFRQAQKSAAALRELRVTGCLQLQ